MDATLVSELRLQKERMSARSQCIIERSMLKARVWNSLAKIKEPGLREAAYNELSIEAECATFHDRWFQVGTYIVGVLDDEFMPTIAVHEILPHQQNLIGIDALTQRAGEIGAEGGFVYHEPIGNALCRARFHDGEFIVNITRA